MKNQYQNLEFNDPDLQKIYDEHIDSVFFDLKYLDQVNKDIKSLELFLSQTLDVNESGFPTPILNLWWCVKEKRIYCESSTFFEGDRRLLEAPKEVRNIAGGYLVEFLKFCLGVK